MFDHTTRIALPTCPMKIHHEVTPSFENAISEDDTITTKTASGKKNFDWGSNLPPGPGKKPTSAVQIQTAPVFSSSSRPSGTGIKAPHKIRLRMSKYEMADGLGPQVSWEWKENRGIARAAQVARRRQAGGPKKAGADGRLKENVFSDLVEEDNMWSGINESDYHARGW